MQHARRTLSSSLDTFGSIRYLGMHYTDDPKEGEDVYWSMHLVPLLMGSLALKDLTEFAIANDHVTNPDDRPRIGSNTHSSFLMSCGQFRNIHTLGLQTFRFSSFSYFIRLILSFRFLRSLKLSWMDFDHARGYSANIARSKGFRLETLGVTSSDKLLGRFIPWLVDARAITGLQKLTLDAKESSSVKHLHKLVAMAGSALTHLDIKNGAGAHFNPIVLDPALDLLRLQLNPCLQDYSFVAGSIQTTHSVVSNISYKTITSLTIRIEIRLEEWRSTIAEWDEFDRLLSSRPFPVGVQTVNIRLWVAGCTLRGNDDEKEEAKRIFLGEFEQRLMKSRVPLGAKLGVDVYLFP